MRRIARFAALAGLMLALKAPASADAAPGFPHSAFPQVACFYYVAFDRILQIWVTDGNAYHLNPESESHTARWVDPQQFVTFKGNDPMNHCDVLFNAGAIDYPLTWAQVMEYHYRHLRYELQHGPVPAKP